MRLARPIYESLPVLYLLAGVLLLFLSHHLHSGLLSLLLLGGGVAALIAGMAVWLRRRDYRAAGEQYWARSDASGDESGDVGSDASSAVTGEDEALK